MGTIAALCDGFALFVFVGRAKKCLDFSATVFFYQCVIGMVYSWPSRWPWWFYGTGLLNVAVCTVVGEQLTIRKEMEEVPRNRLFERDAERGVVGSPRVEENPSGAQPQQPSSQAIPARSRF